MSVLRHFDMRSPKMCASVLTVNESCYINRHKLPTHGWASAVAPWDRSSQGAGKDVATSCLMWIRDKIMTCSISNAKAQCAAVHAPRP